MDRPTVLVLNSGSSSVKYQLIDPESGSRFAVGEVERVGEDDSTTVATLFDELGPALADADVAAVGHRVVMGGRYFDGPARIDDEVRAIIEQLSPLAPLHNPRHLAGIDAARELLPDVPHVAVFDTAFFRALPPAAATYAIDTDVASRHEIRRYGMHGTSHHYVSGRVAEILGRDVADLRQIVLHLGNGASASAVVGGRPVDTSMGLTPLEGLVMGSRSGDIDPAVVIHLVREAGMTVDDVDELLNRRSGMRGLAGDNDLRGIHRLIGEGDSRARLALDVYVHRLRKYIGAYAAVMGGLDAVAFTAGVGEHDAVVRAEAADGLGFLGIHVDAGRNAAPTEGARIISPEGAPVAVLVVPTDEEMMIARQAMDLVG